MAYSSRPRVTTAVEIRGLEELQAKLDRLSDVGAAIGPALIRTGNEIRTHARRYPPATEANRPSGERPDSWYVRGTGGHYLTAKGELHVSKTSQKMSQRWSMTSHVTTREASVRIGNSASYVRYVHDEQRQARFHRARGWRTVQQMIKEFGPKAIKRISAAIEAALRA